MRKIRLEKSEIESICLHFCNNFGLCDRLWIFGSRVNPNARGGDIDLYIETNWQDLSQIQERKQNFLYALYEEIGLQQIDIVINIIGVGTYLYIYDIAKTEGVQLI